MNTNSLSGQIDLLAITGARFENGNIIIPSSNPSVYVCDAKSGQKKAYLDIVIRESPGTQFGNKHFVKTSVGKTNRERLGISRDDIPKYTPIIGNLKPFEFQGQAPASAQQGADDDLPEDDFKGF